jgi:signal transduction histidine kinase
MAIFIVLSLSVLYFQHLIFKNSASLYVGTVRNQALYGEFSQVKLSLTQSLLTFKGVNASFHDSNQVFRYGDESFFKIKLNSYYDILETKKMATYFFYYDGFYGILFSIVMNVLSFFILYVYFRRSKDSIDLEIKLQRRDENIKTLNWISRQVSHDLASPIAAMNNLAYTLNLNADQKSLFNSISKRINDISADISKIPSIDQKMECLEEVKIFDLANKLIPDLINEKNIEYRSLYKIQFIINQLADVVVSIETKDFLRVLSNLLNNAVEASKANDSIVISIDCDKAYLNLSIKDNGKGIPKDILDKLNIESFNYGKRGSGLGIFGARQVLNKVGGKLYITSEFGKGTTVNLTIPVWQD